MAIGIKVKHTQHVNHDLKTTQFDFTRESRPPEGHGKKIKWHTSHKTQHDRHFLFRFNYCSRLLLIQTVELNQWSRTKKKKT